jgi:short-subunit dehydrogenase
MARTRRETVLVTGASSGIGRSTALYLAEKGYVVIGTSRSMARLAELQGEASRRGLTLTPVELDLNSDDQVERLVSGLLKQHGAIDALVNNAGYGLWGPLETLTMAEIKAQFDANFFACVRLIKAVIPGMVEQRRGTIINVSSILGRMGTPFNSAYSASKFALEGLSESLHVELRPLGIRVAVVEPGAIKTAFLENRVVPEGAGSQNLVYSAYMRKYEDRHDRYARLGHDPVKVAKVIHKIVRAGRPSFRYPVGIEARAGTLGARLLPERVFRAMLRRATIGN